MIAAVTAASLVSCFERLAVGFQQASSEQSGITAFTAITALAKAAMAVEKPRRQHKHRC
jgi:hypothetical protein